MTLSSKHKGIFLLITITILLISITAVSAAADDNTTDTNYQTDSTPVDTITTNDIVTEKQSHNSYTTANEPSNTGIIKKTLLIINN